MASIINSESANGTYEAIPLEEAETLLQLNIKDKEKEASNEKFCTFRDPFSTDSVDYFSRNTYNGNVLSDDKQAAEFNVQQVSQSYDGGHETLNVDSVFFPVKTLAVTPDAFVPSCNLQLSPKSPKASLSSLTCYPGGTAEDLVKNVGECDSVSLSSGSLAPHLNDHVLSSHNDRASSDTTFVDQLLASVLKRAQDIDFDDTTLEKFTYDSPLMSTFRNQSEPVSAFHNQSEPPVSSFCNQSEPMSAFHNQSEPMSKPSVDNLKNFSADETTSSSSTVTTSEHELDSADSSSTATSSLSTMKTFNMVMRLQRTVADMQMDMARLQDSMRATNIALQEVVAHLYTQMGWK